MQSSLPVPESSMGTHPIPDRASLHHLPGFKLECIKGTYPTPNPPPPSLLLKKQNVLSAFETLPIFYFHLTYRQMVAASQACVVLGFILFVSSLVSLLVVLGMSSRQHC